MKTQVDIAHMFPDAPQDQRFHSGQWVSHNGGLIELDSKRQITSVRGYDRHGGMSYTLADVEGRDRGLAYDCELDPWPTDETTLPQRSPRTLDMFDCDRSPESKALLWQERWYGSEPEKGSSIVDLNGNLVVYVGGDTKTHALVTDIVQKHNEVVKTLLDKSHT